MYRFLPYLKSREIDVTVVEVQSAPVPWPNNWDDTGVTYKVIFERPGEKCSIYYFDALEEQPRGVEALLYMLFELSLLSDFEESEGSKAEHAQRRLIEVNLSKFFSVAELQELRLMTLD